MWSHSKRHSTRTGCFSFSPYSPSLLGVFQVTLFSLGVVFWDALFLYEVVVDLFVGDLGALFREPLQALDHNCLVSNTQAVVLAQRNEGEQVLDGGVVAGVVEESLVVSGNSVQKQVIYIFLRD